MTAYFTGVSPWEDAGHYCFTPDWKIVWFADETHPATPWADPAGYPLGDSGATVAAWPEIKRDGRTREEPEGEARVRHLDGWTLICLWDRSADARKGSHASFAIHAVLDSEAALSEARSRFPVVWARIDAHLAKLGLSVRLVACTMPGKGGRIGW